MEGINKEDFKYFLQDISKIYVGANFTYGELLEKEDIPYKLKEAVNRVFIKEAGESVTLAEHLVNLTDSDQSYLAFRQLKPRLKVTFFDGGHNKKGSLGLYKDYCSFDDFLNEFRERIKNKECFMEEICIKKRHLMGFSI